MLTETTFVPVLNFAYGGLANAKLFSEKFTWNTSGYGGAYGYDCMIADFCLVVSFSTYVLAALNRVFSVFSLCSGDEMTRVNASRVVA